MKFTLGPITLKPQEARTHFIDQLHRRVDEMKRDRDWFHMISGNQCGKQTRRLDAIIETLTPSPPWEMMGLITRKLLTVGEAHLLYNYDPDGGDIVFTMPGEPK